MNREILNYIFKNKLPKKIRLKKVFFSSIDKPLSNTIFFVKNLTQIEVNKINKLISGIVILKKKNKLIKKNIIQLEKKNPKNFFFKVLIKFQSKEKNKIKPIIGKRTKIYENVFLGNNVKIGDNCIIQQNVVIYDNVKIGNNCKINSNSVLGHNGFGWITNSKKKLILIPHFGKVIIGNDVEIGAMNTVAKGTLTDTVIGSFNKLADHVDISHNCIINENNMICAGTTIGGSVKIGKNNFLGLKTCVKQNIFIGSNNFLGSSSNILKNVGDNKLVYGNPAKEISHSRGYYDLEI